MSFVQAISGVCRASDLHTYTCVRAILVAFSVRALHLPSFVCKFIRFRMFCAPFLFSLFYFFYIFLYIYFFYFALAMKGL